MHACVINKLRKVRTRASEREERRERGSERLIARCVRVKEQARVHCKQERERARQRERARARATCPPEKTENKCMQRQSRTDSNNEKKNLLCVDNICHGRQIRKLILSAVH